MEDTKGRDSIKKGSGLRKGNETRLGPVNEPHALPLPIPWPMEHKKDRSSRKKGKVGSPKTNMSTTGWETWRWRERHGDGWKAPHGA